jgi:hypothetical protein
VNHTQSVISEMRESLIGRRVRLNYTSDPYTRLKAGDEGEVDYIDDIGTVFVKWDNGSTLGLVREAGDKYSLL